MFLKAHTRRKDGKANRYFSLVESVRTVRGSQHRTLAYLGELNSSTEAAWRRSISVFNGDGIERQLELFAADTPDVPDGERVVRVRLDGVRWERPRDFGEIFLANHLWRLLRLDQALTDCIETGDEDVPWPVMAFILTAARLISPSSELAIEQQYYPRTALEDITGIPAEKVNTDRLYRTLDQLLPHKGTLETHLKARLGTLFAEPCDLLLYDLTSTYFEGLSEGNPDAARGYSRDHRPDCAQIVIGLVVTRSGLPLAYEVFAGNRSDSTTLSEIMQRMEELHGKAERVWVFDRGVASEKNLEALRASGGLYLVGTPRTLLRKVERRLLDEDFVTIREGIAVKVVPAPDGSRDTFILCRSAQRREKEAAIYDRFEKKMESGLERLVKSIESGRSRSRDILQQRLGRLRLTCSRVARAYIVEVDGDGNSIKLRWRKDEEKSAYLRQVQGSYLLRTNLVGQSESELWKMYMQLNDAEAAFRTLKQDLAIRPIHHQLQDRVKAHVLVCFLAYALHRTLDALSRPKGLRKSPRQILAQLATIKSGDIILPLTDGRELCLRRVSRPDRSQAELLAQLGLDLPHKIGTDSVSDTRQKCSTDLRHA
jgi:transposase